MRLRLLLVTVETLRSSDGKKPRGTRPKGSAARFEDIREMLADPIDESFETQVIRNALGQLKELAALEVSEHQPRTKRAAAEKLREKHCLERTLLTAHARKSWLKQCREGGVECGRTRLTFSDGSMASKALRLQHLRRM